MFGRLFKKSKPKAFEEIKADSNFNIKPANIQFETIFLPKLRFIKQKKKVDLISPEYFSIIDDARSLYNRKLYLESKEEFLKCYNFEYKADTYFTHLIRAYRKAIEKFNIEENYSRVFELFEEMFDKCPNYSITDLKKYNKIVKLINMVKETNHIEFRELKINEVEDFEIDSKEIFLFSECLKPRGFKITKTDKTTYTDLTKFANFISHDISYITFQEGQIRYKEDFYDTEINYSPYRFKESTDCKYFITSTIDSDILVFNWELELLKSINVSIYSETHTELRCVDLALNSSLFLFTNIDKAYILDSNLDILKIWEAPHKDGYEKRSNDNISDFDNHLLTLKLTGKPTQEEIKKSFRRLLLQNHPDINQDRPDAEENTRDLIQAYEVLTGEDAKKALEGENESEFYWVNIKNTKTYNIHGINIEMSFSIGSGEDWIYGSGISDDGQRIYLGCYSGKVYQINQSGRLLKKYIIPEDETGIYGSTNPISSIREFKERLYILTSWYLYILQNDVVVKYIPVNDGNIKWFENGFVLLEKEELTIFDLDGRHIAKVIFKQKIKHICYTEGYFIVTTLSKSYCFKWSK